MKFAIDDNDCPDHRYNDVLLPVVAGVMGGAPNAASDRPGAPLPTALRGISHTGDARPGPVTEAEYTAGVDAVGIVIARLDS
ncbi:hypothetical protein [Paraburkholderia panacisoli]|uniref:hypothetical protein n=1 Tax=Paraburkholderia panacisoli TaxID=2603818 RepID=UPI00165F5652|nr:hypothetical protein [Paraburkholderia panacisoli]